MYQSLIKELKQRMAGVIGQLEEQLKAVHTGRATSALVEDLKINHYNTLTPLKQLASISVPEANIIQINPWDPGALVPIESAVRASHLQVSANNDGKSIRLIFPPMSAERREDLSKLVKTKAEEARVALRTAREEAWKNIQKMERDKQITEDDRDDAKKELNELIGEFNDIIGEISDKKVKEIETV